MPRPSGVTLADPPQPAPLSAIYYTTDQIVSGLPKQLVPLPADAQGFVSWADRIVVINPDGSPLGGAPVVKNEYDITASLIYKGYAPLGTALSAAAWRIQRITLVSGNPTESVWSTGTAVWNNRASEAYT